MAQLVGRGFSSSPQPPPPLHPLSPPPGRVEDVLFSDVVTKINRYDVSQERLFVVTSGAVYNLSKARKVKRRIDVLKIESVSVSQVSDEFAVHVPTEYDYRITSARKSEAVDCIVTAHFNATGVTIPVKYLATVALKEVVVTKGKAPAAAGGGAVAGAGSTVPAATGDAGGVGSSAGGAAGGSGAAGAGATGFAMSTAVGELVPIVEGVDEDGGDEGKRRVLGGAAAATSATSSGGSGGGGGSGVTVRVLPPPPPPPPHPTYAHAPAVLPSSASTPSPFLSAVTSLFAPNTGPPTAALPTGPLAAGYESAPSVAGRRTSMPSLLGMSPLAAFFPTSTARASLGGGSGSGARGLLPSTTVDSDDTSSFSAGEGAAIAATAPVGAGEAGGARSDASVPARFVARGQPPVPGTLSPMSKTASAGMAAAVSPSFQQYRALLRDPGTDAAGKAGDPAQLHSRDGDDDDGGDMEGHATDRGVLTRERRQQCNICSATATAGKPPQGAGGVRSDGGWHTIDSTARSR